MNIDISGYIGKENQKQLKTVEVKLINLIEMIKSKEERANRFHV